MENPLGELSLGLVACISATLGCTAQTISVSGTNGSSPAVTSLSVSRPINISVTNFTSGPLVVLPYDSSDFSSLAASLPAASRAAIKSLLPYCVFIKNEGQRPLIAYSVGWISTDAAGKTYTDYHTVGDVVRLQPVIRPRTAALATVLGPLDDPLVASNMVSDIAEQARTFAGRVSLSISLESVVFDDGTSIGADRSKAIPQIKARLKAEYDLYNSILEKAGNSPAPDVSSWLQALAESVPPGSHLAFSDDPFPTWYEFYKGRIAAGLMGLSKRKGFPELAAYVRSQLSTKPYPALLIK